MTYREQMAGIWYDSWRLYYRVAALFCTLISDAAMYVGRKFDGWAEDGHRQVARLAEEL